MIEGMMADFMRLLRVLGDRFPDAGFARLVPKSSPINNLTSLATDIDPGGKRTKMLQPNTLSILFTRVAP